jgi:ribose transport system ATP-binding protein
MPQPGMTALRIENVSKTYGATRALDEVSLEVARGEVHALLGHNGSGKSTLVKAIGGAVRPDRGEIVVGGVPGAAPRLGVVHQELALCAEASVLENCCIGGYRRRWGLIDWKRERVVVEQVLAQLDADFDCAATVGALSPADQAITAIARALKPVRDNAGLDLLVLDEATAALRGPDADKVLAAARKVSAAGGGVLLVTHHMSEVLSSADRATVLVSGAVTATVEVATATQDSLLELISGRPLAGLHHPLPQPEDRPHGRPRLVVSGLRGDSVHGVDLTVGKGEIVGLTGAAGSGHEQVPYLLSGFQRPSSGQISVDGKARTVHSVPASQRAGIGILPADRLARGVLSVATIRENLSPTTRARHRAKGLLRSLAERRWAKDICKEYEVSTCDTEALMSSLSGGNQQKVLLARVLESHPKVAILHEPTQGVDEATRRALVRKIRELATSGVGVLYVSSDAEEVVGCADRVVVMRRGRSVAVIPGGMSQLDDIFAACYGTTSGRTIPGHR